jgi:DHA3 family macrolide efflux protein-like MFS transporter
VPLTSWLAFWGPRRRITMMVADGVGALAAGVLAGLFALGWVQVWHVFVILFVRSCAGAFHWPAMQASTSLMVPKQHLSRIQGLNQMLWVRWDHRRPLGALVMDLYLYSVVAIDVVTAAFALSTVLRSHSRSPNVRYPQHRLPVKASAWADMKPDGGMLPGGKGR